MPTLAIISLIGITLLETVAYIVLMIYYSLAMYAFQLIDNKLQNYDRDNQCSDGVL